VVKSKCVIGGATNGNPTAQEETSGDREGGVEESVGSEGINVPRGEV